MTGALAPTSVGPSTKKPRRRSSFRPDIQGLRAVAVVAVVLDHLFHWPVGGFVGVDIFFVISGYLITGLLIREWKRSGTISFVDFYRRRIKRILPASLLVIAVTLLVAKFLFAGPRWQELKWDALFSTLFSANWRFLATGSDYFQADGPVSPLRHYWSLAVEEQYYFVWPWLLLGVLIVARAVAKRSSGPMRAAATVIAVITVVSFLWALFETGTNPTAAYYDTAARVWELGVGALIAFGEPLWTRISDGMRPWLANLGLLGLVAAVFLVQPSPGFPAPAGLLPVLSTGIIIVAGAAGDHRYIAPLTNPVSRYLGDISFSLYLWHFPVIIFLGILLPHDWFYYVAALALMLVLSAYSYRLVEDPIRKSNWLTPRAVRSEKEPVSPRRRQRAMSALVRAALSGAVVIALLLAAVFTRSAMVPAVSLPESPVGASASGPAVAVSGPETAKVQEELEVALTATKWPAFDPSLEDIMANDPYPEGVHQCGEAGPHPAEDCTWGPPDATKHAVLVGDSISMRWATPLTELYAKDGWNIRVLGLYGCPFNRYPIQKEPESAAECDARKAEAIEAINETNPDVVFIGNTHVPETMSTTGAPATPADWGDGMREILAELPADTTKVILSPPPFDKDVRECYNPVSSPQDCVGQVPQLWFDIADQDRAATASVANGIYVDTRALYCTPVGLCPPMAAGIPIKQDHTHMTMYYGYHIEAALAEMLRDAGVPS
jgi:peptidoglycan/LPS O-acetylase OafA/YrhL